MTARTKIYFASDFHLGSYPQESSIAREKKIVAWLDYIKDDAQELFLVGDVFDFWFEYNTVVPKGFIRFLGKLAELADQGVKITLFKGNHDMWMFGYLKDQLGAEIVDHEKVISRNGKSFYIHHGDGLGPGDKKYKFLKTIFRSSFCQRLFAFIHPDLGMAIAHKWSQHSRASAQQEEPPFDPQREWLIHYAEEILQQQYYDYFIFGHRHLAYQVDLTPKTSIVNLGEWIQAYTYAVWDGETLTRHIWSSKP